MSAHNTVYACTLIHACTLLQTTSLRLTQAPASAHGSTRQLV